MMQSRFNNLEVSYAKLDYMILIHLLVLASEGMGRIDSREYERLLCEWIQPTPHECPVTFPTMYVNNRLIDVLVVWTMCSHPWAHLMVMYYEHYHMDLTIRSNK